MYDLRLFAIRAFSAGNASLLVAFMALFVAIFLMPFFLQRGQGLTILKAGLLLTPLSLITLVIAPLSGSLSDRIGSRFLATSGLLIMGAALFSLTQLDAQASDWETIWRLALVGFGLGLFTSPNNSPARFPDPGSAVPQLRSPRCALLAKYWVWPSAQPYSPAASQTMPES